VRRLRREIEKYVAAVAKADDVPELVAALKKRKEQLAEAEQEQEALTSPLPRLTPFEIYEMCGEQLRRFDDMLRGDIAAARQALRALLPAPLRLRPATADGRRTLAFEGVTTRAHLAKGLASPRGNALDASLRGKKLDWEWRATLSN
jgi:hypothetical protein